MTLGRFFRTPTFTCFLNNINPSLRSIILNIFKLAKVLFVMNKTISSQCFSECSEYGLYHFSAVILTSSLLLQKCTFWWERASSSTICLLCKLRNPSTFFFMIQISTSPPAYNVFSLTVFLFLLLSFRYSLFLPKTSICYVKSVGSLLTFCCQCNFISALLTEKYPKVG